MKKTDWNIEKLFECYQRMAIDYHRSDVISLARSILNDDSFLLFVEKCIEFENMNITLLEASLGLSGVQNKDNL
jgi:hypothetical protein